ncbi:amino acid/polyamine transporter I [Durotheca rogersii]|uniref:amino acid/polyamine transporter I n=1 Tax=Durotheca rogersii TaxID=419775 RepID=UPI00221E89C4|nr:amino acid/polyamine transporter I [Durotheca rogersii]KAI5860925.1 amino acid/polyamine transporter I [Durotheca rogersii]
MAGPLSPARSRDARYDQVIAQDAATLAQLGHKQELKRNFSMLSMLGLAFAILNTWTALAASISLALPSGGPSAVIWGLVVAGVCNLCLAASLAEFLSAYPTAGGQYHWAAIVAWRRWSRGISYVTGWINVSGWVALASTGGLLGSTLVLNIVALLHPDFEPQPWHQFLMYLAFTLLAFAINAFGTRLLPLITKAALLWSLAGFVIVSITILACAAPDFQSGAFVYGRFTNEVGWPDGIAWLLGLLQGAFSLTGFDAVAHMIEEIPQPQVRGPRIMLACIGIGVATGFVFLSCLLFCARDLDGAIASPAGPLLRIFADATGSPAGSVCLLVFPIGCVTFAATLLMTTSSRMSYAFARDGGLPFSGVLARVHGRLDVPLNALLWTAGWAAVFGCIFLGSTSTFNAITSASVVALGVTYAIPPTINVLRGRRMLPPDRPFRMPELLGWVVNLVGIAWTVLTTVLFVFPPALPVTSANMNYCVAAFGIMLLLSLLTWVLDGRKNYKGPLIVVAGIGRGDKTASVEGVSTALPAGEEDGGATPASKAATAATKPAVSRS